MKQNKFPILETMLLLAFEISFAAIVVVVYAILKKFDYTVITGAVFGTAVSVLNFVFLSIAVNRAVDNVLKDYPIDEKKLDGKTDGVLNEKTDGEISDSEEIDEAPADDGYDDEAARFAKENQMKVANAVKLSYIVRTATMIGALVLAFLTKQFNLIATLVPLLTFRYALTFASGVAEKIRKKETIWK